MDLSSLQQDVAANLKHLAEAGDMLGQVAVNVVSAKLVSLGAPAAPGAAVVHASVFGDAVGPVTLTAGITSPDVPRNISALYGATYDGGALTIIGEDQHGNHLSETLGFSAGVSWVSNATFSKVTSITYAGGGVGTHSTNTVSVGTGAKLGLVQKPAIGSPMQLTVNGVGEAVTFDASVNAIVPTSAPNGTKVFDLLFNM